MGPAQITLSSRLLVPAGAVMVTVWSAGQSPLRLATRCHRTFPLPVIGAGPVKLCGSRGSAGAGWAVAGGVQA